MKVAFPCWDTCITTSRQDAATRLPGSCGPPMSRVATSCGPQCWSSWCLVRQRSRRDRGDRQAEGRLAAEESRGPIWTNTSPLSTSTGNARNRSAWARRRPPAVQVELHAVPRADQHPPSSTQASRQSVSAVATRVPLIGPCTPAPAGVGSGCDRPETHRPPETPRFRSRRVSRRPAGRAGSRPPAPRGCAASGDGYGNRQLEEAAGGLAHDVALELRVERHVQHRARMVEVVVRPSREAKMTLSRPSNRSIIVSRSRARSGSSIGCVQKYISLM